MFTVVNYGELWLTMVGQFNGWWLVRFPPGFPLFERQNTSRPPRPLRACRARPRWWPHGRSYSTAPQIDNSDSSTSTLRESGSNCQMLNAAQFTSTVTSTLFVIVSVKAIRFWLYSRSCHKVHARSPFPSVFDIIRARVDYILPCLLVVQGTVSQQSLVRSRHPCRYPQLYWSHLTYCLPKCLPKCLPNSAHNCLTTWLLIVGLLFANNCWPIVSQYCH